MANKRYMDVVPSKRPAKSGATALSTAGQASGAMRRTSGATRQTSGAAPVVQKRMTTSVARTMAKTATGPAVIGRTSGALPSLKSKQSRVSAAKITTGAQLGVIEDYRPKFVPYTAEKRPLGEKKALYGGSGRKSAASVSSVKAVQALRKTQAVSSGSLGVKPLRTANNGVSWQKANLNAANAGASPMKPRPLKVPGSDLIKKRAMQSEALKPETDIEPVKKTSAFGLIKKAPQKNVYKKSKKKVETDEPVKIVKNEEKESRMGLVVAVVLTIILGAAAGTVAFLLLPK